MPTHILTMASQNMLHLTSAAFQQGWAISQFLRKNY